MSFEKIEIAIMNPKLPFGKAFGAAREGGFSHFEWRGKRYTTELFEEVAKQFDDYDYIIDIIYEEYQHEN
jgi:hypothetical protein